MPVDRRFWLVLLAVAEQTVASDNKQVAWVAYSWCIRVITPTEWWPTTTSTHVINSSLLNQLTLYIFVSAVWEAYTQRNIFEFLLNQPEIRLYLPFSDWFGSKRTSVWIKIIRKMVTTIWFQVDLIRFRKDLSVCSSISRVFSPIGCPKTPLISDHTI